MARIIQMPSRDDLPEGPRREFVEALRVFYRSAGRPALREISKRIEGRDDLKEVTASQETVRRVLRGLVIPHDWNRVNAVLQVCCELAEIDPDADHWPDSNYDDVESHRAYIKRLWDEALEAEPNAPRTLPPTPPPPPSRSGFGGNPPGGPWAPHPGRGGGYSDDPPF